MAVDVGGVSSPPPQGCTFIIINDKAMCDVSGNKFLKNSNLLHC